MPRLISKKQIALVHVAKARCGLTDAEYRDLLYSVGVSTSAELNQGNLKALLKRFESLGFKSRRPLKAPPAKQAMIERILATCSELGLTRRYADALAKKASSGNVKRLEWCSTTELHAVTAMMAYKQKKNTGRIYRKGSR